MLKTIDQERVDQASAALAAFAEQTSRPPLDQLLEEDHQDLLCVSKAASTAQGNLKTAENNLVSECRKSAQQLSTGQSAALQLCDALASSSSGG